MDSNMFKPWKLIKCNSPESAALRLYGQLAKMNYLCLFLPLKNDFKISGLVGGNLHIHFQYKFSGYW